MIFLFVLAGIAGFSVIGLANTLSTSNINAIQTLQIVDVHKKSMKFVDLGTSTTISSVPLSFKGSNNFWNGRDVFVDIYDIDGTLIGTGSVTASNNKPIVPLTDTITVAERPTIRQVTISTNPP